MPSSLSSPDRRTLAHRLAADWIPPRLLRTVTGLRPTPPAAAPPPAQAPLSPAVTAAAEAALDKKVEDDPRWVAMNSRVLEEIAGCDAAYRPTNFWGPALDQLLGDWNSMGLSTFKRWPRAGFWFLPLYGNGFSNLTIRQTFRRAKNVNPSARKQYVTAALNGSLQAHRDFDAARLGWDQTRWPADLDGFGESRVGEPWQHYRLASGRTDVGFGRAYLNYMLVLAGLSRHVDTPPRSFLELGGGFGALGEFVMARDPEARYVNLDIPPLVTLSSYYLTELFGDDRVLTYGPEVPSTGHIEVPRSACLPNWRIEDIKGPFDVFVNTYSFQEMEPDVVENYADKVAALGVEYVASLNSLAGKPVATEERAIGVLDQVTSPRIIEMFEKRGYRLLSTYQRPLLNSAGELAILRRI